jgi:hypothetical protein
VLHPVLVPGLFIFFTLDVVRQDDARGHALAQRDTDRSIDDVPKLGGLRDHLHVARNVLQEWKKIDFLLFTAADSGERLLANE